LPFLRNYWTDVLELKLLADLNFCPRIKFEVNREKTLGKKKEKLKGKYVSSSVVSQEINF